MRGIIGLLLVLVISFTVGACKARVAGDNAEASDHRAFSLEVDSIKGASALDDDAHEGLKVALEGMIVRGLEEEAWFSSSSKRVLEAEIIFELLDAPEGSKGSVFHVVCTLRGEDEHGDLGFRGEAWSAIEPEADEGLDALRVRASRLAVEELLRQLTLAVEVALLEKHALSERLRRGSPEALRLVVHEVVRRRDEALLEDVRGLLMHPNRDVVLVATAALGQLKDKEASASLFDLVTSQDLEKVSQALTALGAICDEGAEGYLRQALAFPEPVRTLAEESLMGCLSRKGSP